MAPTIEAETAGALSLVGRATDRLPELVRFLLLICAWGIAVGAALAPIVYLLRRIGVG